ncbi:carboxypeptidase-like regulatory domain-containing protein [Aureibacter tunicatorum]|uniref:CarboxypepD_reg-like domain-containing protein n=1 Tax=Aureibacter tunicatorum TaxID=866807 RepID=A0AAE3XRR3_9BACT|nr:carboxypeptidase-like regulatory domain-containing protein [Aureibacter tunicatorum]MDR6241548.1 hypothetical protein [Aureibacter tunicatorum]BDD07228.1 hypothetical protein AUTU_47110 [Aureibacter tunicatorum]
MPSFNLKINQPCGEDFNKFTPTEKGGFCQSCQKEVIDFTNMSESEIIEYIQASTKKTCGRFKSSQLKHYHIPVQSSRFGKFRSCLTFAVISFLSILNTEAKTNEISKKPKVELQEEKKISTNLETTTEKYTITGRVMESSGEGAIGVNVVLKGTIQGTATDFDGNFSLTLDKPKGILVFSGIGYQTQEIEYDSNQLTNLTVYIDADIKGLLTVGEVNTSLLYSSKKSIWQRIKDFF